jgi:hypothetical protein
MFKNTMKQEDDLSDPIFDDMTMPDSAERRKFLEACRESFGEGAQTDLKGKNFDYGKAFEDWKFFASLMLRMGLVDLNNENICRELNDKTRITKGDWEGGWNYCTGWEYATDECGRIDRLQVVLSDVQTDLLAGIRRLDCLRSLYITGHDVNSLPLKELSLLPKLRELFIGGSSDLLSDSFLAQESLKFSSLRKLTLRDSSSFQMLHRCVALENLTFCFVTESEIDAILDILGSSDFCFAETLQKLNFVGYRGSQVKGNHLETFLFQVVPRFPNLEQLEISPIFIMTLKVIADRIRSDKPCIISKSLRSIRFQGRHGRQKREQIDKDPGMKAALLTFLESFNTIDTLPLPSGIKVHSDNDWKYALIQNKVGRRILEGSGVMNESSNFPLSVWPIVLQRVRRKTEYVVEESRKSAEATGIYYLLRKGPALIGRKDLVDNPDVCPTPIKRQRYGNPGVCPPPAKRRRKLQLQR